MAGRRSFIESFRLFGYDLDDCDELFAEIELFGTQVAPLARAEVARRSSAAGAVQAA